MGPNQPPDVDDRAAQAKAYHWASLVVSIALTMVAPPLLGMLLGRWLSPPRWQVIWISLGGAIGLWLGLRQLLKLAANIQNRPRSRRAAVRPPLGGVVGSDSPPIHQTRGTVTEAITPPNRDQDSTDTKGNEPRTDELN